MDSLDLGGSEKMVVTKLALPGFAKTPKFHRILVNFHIAMEMFHKMKV